MKRLIYFFTMLCMVCLCSCQGKNEPEIDPREKFVGTYSLDVASEVQIYDGKNYYPFDMSARNKTITIAIDPSTKDKFIVSGYYGNTSATLQDGKMYIDEGKSTSYSSGVYVEIRFIHMGATVSATRMTWETGVIIAAVGISGSSANALAGSGTLTNTATKR